VVKTKTKGMFADKALADGEARTSTAEGKEAWPLHR
jgi:hypothetical protein